MYHAWYSKSQERHLNENGRTANIYLGESGKEIKITEVVKISDVDTIISPNKWEDVKYLGTVVKWVKAAEPIIGIDRFNQAKKERGWEERILRYTYQ